MKEVFELVFDKAKKGAFRFSLVKGAAVETTLIKFSQETEKPIYFADEEQRIIYSVALRPNKMIFRKEIPNTGKPGYVYYTEDTVKELLINYFRQNGNSESNINHEEESTPGVFPFESWIVEDPTKDKSAVIGLETMKGDLVLGFKIDNDEVWTECKNGNLDGLSVEAYFGFKETNINFNNENGMKAELLKFFKNIFGAEPAEIATGYWAKDKEVGTVVLDKDGNTAANAEFEIDGKKVKTDADGKILAPVAEVKQEDEKTLEQYKTENADLQEKVNNLEAEKAKWEGEKTKSEADLATMKAEKEKAEGEKTKMSTEKTAAETAKKTAEDALAKFKAETPAAEPIKYNVPPEKMASQSSDKKYEDMSNVEKAKYNKEKRG